jgi:hypothetical protein
VAGPVNTRWGNPCGKQAKNRLVSISLMLLTAEARAWLAIQERGAGPIKEA